jgi:hypothetical protein
LPFSGIVVLYLYEPHPCVDSLFHENGASASNPISGRVRGRSGAFACAPNAASFASYKGGELEDAVTRLQKLRMQPTLTAQQRMAVQDSVAAVMREVYSLAEKGDQRAIQAVKQYKEMQTSRH